MFLTVIMDISGHISGCGHEFHMRLFNEREWTQSSLPWVGVASTKTCIMAMKDIGLKSKNIRLFCSVHLLLVYASPTGAAIF